MFEIYALGFVMRMGLLLGTCAFRAHVIDSLGEIPTVSASVSSAVNWGSYN